MARLPNPGSDKDTWGTLLNAYLLLEHNADGTHINRALLVENVNTVGTSGATQTLPDVSVDTIHRITLSVNCTITLPTPAAGKSLTVVLVQDVTGSRTVTWATPSGVIKWPGAVIPSLTAAANSIDMFAFSCIDGTNWLGALAGADFR